MTSSDIRSLSAAEAPLLLPPARAFHQAHDIGVLNEAHYVAELSRLLLAQKAIVLAAGIPIRGTIGGVLFQDIATGVLNCMEYFWWVSPAERGTLGLRLLGAFEIAARTAGASRLFMMHLADERDAQFQRLYERRHYTLREKVYVKELNR